MGSTEQGVWFPHSQNSFQRRHLVQGQPDGFNFIIASLVMIAGLLVIPGLFTGKDAALISVGLIGGALLVAVVVSLFQLHRL